jgi:hypothetical protein
MDPQPPFNLGPGGYGYRLRTNGLSPRFCKNLHPHHFDTTIGQNKKFGKLILHIGHLVMGIKISLIGEHFVENEMPRGFSIFLKKIDQILRITSDERDKRKCGGTQLGFLAGLCPHLGDN